MIAFGHVVNGRERPARRITVGALGWSYGLDRGRKLIVELCAGDLIVFRAHGTRRRYSLSAFDAFAYLMRCHAQAEAREKRAARAARRRERSR